MSENELRAFRKSDYWQNFPEKPMIECLGNTLNCTKTSDNE